MKSFVFLTTLALSAPSTSNEVPNQYIVVLKKNTNSLTASNQAFEKLSLDSFSEDESPVKLHEFDLPNFKGFTVKLPQSFTGDEQYLMNLLSDDVDYIQPDHYIYANVVEQTDAPWGLKRLSNDGISSSTYSYPESAGRGIDAYVIDTGIFTNHPEFQGRAVWGGDFSGENKYVDAHGHGTHVSGTIGSKTYGVAKNVNIIGVKVLDSTGRGTDSSVIAGIDYVSKKVAERKSEFINSVANMSLGGSASKALDDAVTAAIENGVVFVVAAGNSAGDACNISPARVPKAITVAASGSWDRFALFSEKGKCVDIIAPGINVQSTWNNGKTNTISGTSMASPHVAGVVALALAENNFSTVQQVTDHLLAKALKGKVWGFLGNTPNLLLNSGY